MVTNKEGRARAREEGRFVGVIKMILSIYSRALESTGTCYLGRGGEKSKQKRESERRQPKTGHQCVSTE